MLCSPAGATEIMRPARVDADARRAAIGVSFGTAKHFLRIKNTPHGESFEPNGEVDR